LSIEKPIDQENTAEVLMESNGFDIFKILHNQRLKNPNNIIISYLNINSIRNKIENLKQLVTGNIDILVISETKLDDSFLTSIFEIPGFHSPIRLDINSRKGGLLVYIRNDIAYQYLSHHRIPVDIQVVPFEINLLKKKWLVIAIYKPPSQDDLYFFNSLSNIVDFYSRHYENHVILGDFNLEPISKRLLEFNENYQYYNLIKSKTCFKKAEGTCSDLILTNNKFFLFRCKDF